MSIDQKLNTDLEQMKKYLEPERRLHELTSSSVSSALEQINKTLKPLSFVQEQMEKYLEPQRRLHELTSSSVSSALEQMNKALRPENLYQEHMKKYLESQRRFQELISPSVSSILEQMYESLKPQSFVQGQIENYLLPLNRYLSDPLINGVSINNDGTFSVGDEFVSVEDISECFDNIPVNYKTHFDVSHFFVWLEKLSKPLQFVVVILILPYFIAIIANLTTPIYEEWWKEYSNKEPRMAKIAINREANEIYSTEDLQGYRFVSAKILYVRKFGSINADIVDELYLGKIVRLIEKDKSWCLIEYQDSDADELKQGWVFLRYISKFDK